MEKESAQQHATAIAHKYSLLAQRSTDIALSKKCQQIADRFHSSIAKQGNA